MRSPSSWVAPLPRLTAEAPQPTSEGVLTVHLTTLGLGMNLLQFDKKKLLFKKLPYLKFGL